MSDGPMEFDRNDVEEAVDWACRTGALLIMMDNAERATTGEEALEILEGMHEAIESAIERMPDRVTQAAIEVANDTIEAAIDEEEQVEQLRQEIDNLKSIEDL